MPDTVEGIPEINNSSSSSFTVTNGVRQGGILSPYLFNVYVDDLSVKLNSCHVGCYYSGGCIKSVLNLQMTYIIIAHIYEQWYR